MTRPKRVALIIETSNEYARGLLHGVRGYLREHKPWSIYFGEYSRGQATPWLKQWKGDGIIARIENEAIAKAVVQARLPAVDVSAARHVPQLPWVETDNDAIARLAAEHLLERGFKSFGFCGVPAFRWSQEREQSFTRMIAAAGYPCSVYPPGVAAAPAGSPASEQTALSRWVRRLPKPTGVMAAYDIRAQQLLEACRRIEVAVPDELAVVGVDNDELLCDLADPPLSSIMPDTDQTGYLAAQLLDRMMAGEKVAPSPHLIKPLGIVPRQSTDVLATSDEDVVRAVRFIREHACEGIKVDAVLDVVGSSRRVFESQFRKVLGRTPHQEILRVQIERAKMLLSETKLPLSAIAAQTGFKHVEYLSVVFKRLVGVPPSAYRDQRRSKPDV